MTRSRRPDPPPVGGFGHVVLAVWGAATIAAFVALAIGCIAYVFGVGQ